MEMWLGLIRHLLTFGGGFLITKGVADEATVTGMVGALVTVIGGAWSIYDKYSHKNTPEA